MSQRFVPIFLIVFQLCILIGIWFLGSLIQHIFHLPISAGVIGLLLLLSALLLGLFKIQWIKNGADFILSELVLLFIPCVVGLIKYKDLFLTQGWQLILAVTLGTICVMIVTAYTVHLGFQLETYLKKMKDTSSKKSQLKHGE